MKNYDTEHIKKQRADRLALAQELIANLSEYGLTLSQLADKTRISLPSLKSFRHDPTALGRQRWNKTEILIQLWGILELKKKIGGEEANLFSDYVDTVFDKAMTELSDKEQGILQASKEMIINRPEGLAELYYNYKNELKRKKEKKQDQHKKAFNYLLNHSDEFSDEELQKILCQVSDRLNKHNVEN